MAGCDNFEIAIEQRLRGQLDMLTAAQLDEHLTACSSCRAFEEQSRQMEDAMRMHATVVLENVDWRRIESRFEQWKETVRNGPWRAALLLVVVMPICWLAFGDLTGGAVGGIAVLLLGRRSNRLLLEAAQQAETSPDSLLAFYRKQLDRRIKAVKQDSWALPIMALLPWLHLYFWGEMTSLRITGTILAMCLLVGLGLRSRFICLPHLRRERAALD